MGLSLEQEGLYVRMCMFIAETGRRVPLDDSQAARMLNLNTNQYRKVLGQLLVQGKITRHANGYGNDRVEHEREEAQKATDRKSSTSPTREPDREADQRPERKNHAATTPVTPLDTRVDTPLDTPLALAQKTQHNQYPFKEPEPEPKIEESQLASRAQSELKLAFNGSTANMIADVARFMGVLPSDPCATKWLQSTLSASGPDATLAAYQSLVQGQGEGVPIAVPLRYWAKTAATIKLNGNAPQNQSRTVRDNRPAWEIEKDEKLAATKKWLAENSVGVPG
jgi:uncharacterized protein YdaU (DUF1376 family)